MRAPTRWGSAWLLAALAAAALAAGALAAGGIDLTLRHRQAREVLPVLRPLLGPLGAASGQGRHLFLYDEADRLPFLRRVVRQLDQPAVWLTLYMAAGATPPAAGGPRRRAATTHPPEVLSLRLATGRPAFLQVTGRREALEVWAAFAGDTQGVLLGRHRREARRGFQVIAARRGRGFELALVPAWEAEGGEGRRVYRIEAATHLRLPPRRWVALNPPPPGAAGTGPVRRFGTGRGGPPRLYFRVEP